MKKWVLLLVAIGIFTLSACFGEGSPGEPEIPAGELNQRPKGDHIASIGYEGLEEEIVFQTYQNSWVRILYDSRLAIEQEANQVSFSRQDYESELTLFYLVNPDSEADFHSSNRRAGYNLITDFGLEDLNGTGYIYYSREERHTVELYVIEGRGKKIIVQFSLPETEFDQYIHSFEYMLESIEIL